MREVIIRTLIACCDGTWNAPEQEFVTNVFRVYNALGETDSDGNRQVRYYQSGVGTAGGLLTWVWGGIAGVGLSANVMDAYQWLTTTYEPGDRVALFGFSRGAYTARSIAGVIAACGLLDVGDQESAAVRQQVEHVYNRKYRLAERADPDWRKGLKFSYDPIFADRIPVRFIGVWDTVGSLGIPDNLGLLNLWDSRKRYRFHDVTLNPFIRFARHAIAMDERRVPFAPTLWDESAAGPGQDIQQVWFPGSHMDVGGGYRENGLSNGALLWMIREAEKAGLAFDSAMTGQISPDAGDVLHEDDRAALRSLGPLYDPLVKPLVQPFFETRPRAVPRIDLNAQIPQLAESVYERHARKILISRPYRPTRVLAAGGPGETVTVFANEPWNETGLYLEPGRYLFAARGEWRDSHIRSGPAGTTGLRQLNPIVERIRLVGTVLGWAERLFRRVFGNESANFLVTRREEDLPWMSLVGVVAKRDPSDSADVAGRSRYQRIAIGAGSVAATVTEGGYLYAFANDAFGFYGNNRGDVRLTVTRAA